MFAFTLAEVLITLVIIGVIAAITVPTLITKYQKEQTVTKLKKTYSTLSQTTARAIADNGPVKTWDTYGTSLDDAIRFSNMFLLPYLNVSKKCEDKVTDECEYNFYYKNSADATSLKEEATRFYLNDGTFVGVFTEHNIDYPALVGNIYVDINGQKKPNKMGKDLFVYKYIIRHRFYPNYTGKFIPNCLVFTRTNLLSNCSTGNGECCSALIMYDSWQIKDDYPW